MARLFPVSEVSRTIEGSVPAHRILKPGASGGLALATAASDRLVAISRRTRSAGEVDDVGQVGEFPLEYGAAVQEGQELTSDSEGRGVPAATTNRVIGIAGEAGQLGTIGSCVISPGTKP